MATPVSITRDSSQTDRAVLGIRELVLRGEFKAGERLADIDAVLAEKGVDLDHLNRYSAANERFHQLMLDASGSEMVKRSLKRVTSLPFASPNAFVLAQAKIPDAFDLLKIAQAQHHDIVDTIEARAGARVEALVKEHARIARKNLQLALLHADALDYIVGGPLIKRHAEKGR